MRYLSLLVILTILSLTSCRNDFEFEASTGGLEFSKDTVYLDTVFSNIGSSTYRLKVYNRSDKDISIPEIKLQKGTTSKYRIMVDGMTGVDADNNGIGDGKQFNNVELLAKDSLFIFIETTAAITDANPTDFLYTDKILFTNVGGSTQDVDLVTLIQDAIFIYPQRSGSPGSFLYEGINLGVDDENATVAFAGSNLSETDPVNGNELIWTNQKPYVIYGYALVPDGKTLTVNAGARVHFHANSGLIVGKNAIIKVNGTAPSDNNPANLTNEVIFEGDRLEPQFSEVPGQWGTIMVLSTSAQNEINHLTIKNATVGLLIQNIATGEDASIPQLTIKNSQIYNCSNVGILARKSNLTGENVVGNYCGQATFAGTLGGNYNFTHCTFNNNWNSSKQVAVLLNNYYDGLNNTRYYADLVSANFTNCIIYGSNQIELLYDKKTEVSTLFNYKFNHCLIKFNNLNNQFSNNPMYAFTDSSLYSNCKIATNSQLFNPKYKDANNNKMWPTEDLDAVITPQTTSSLIDILGKTRTNVGAYQFIPN